MKTRVELLAGQSAYELADLCMRMGLPPAAGGERKAETAARVDEAMDRTPDLVRTSIGLDCLDAVREAVGSRRGDITLPLSRLDKDEALGDALDMLKHFGLAYRDRHCWHLLPEVRRLVKLSAEERQDLEVSADMLRHFTLTVNRYGTVPVDVATGPAADGEEALIHMGMLALYSQYHGLSGFCAGPDGRLWLRSPDCGDAAGTITAQMACAQRGIDWAGGGLSDVFAFSDAVVPLTERASGILKDVLEQLPDVDTDLIADCLEDAFFCLQDGDRENAVAALCDIFTEEERTPARRWLMDRLLNHLPVWTLRGHSISEISGGQPQKTKPGPDDPCPCGSGRTWAKCHGRRN